MLRLSGPEEQNILETMAGNWGQLEDKEWRYKISTSSEAVRLNTPS